MKPKVDMVKVVTIAGSVLGIAGTLLSGWSSNKAMKETIAKEVAEALAEQQKKS